MANEQAVRSHVRHEMFHALFPAILDGVVYCGSIRIKDPVAWIEKGHYEGV